MQFVNNPVNPHPMPARRFLAIGIMCAMALSAAMPAQAARIDVRTLTCQQAVNLVHTRKAIVLTLTNNTYDRIVRDFLQCMRDEQTKNVFAQTLDSPRCLIGKRCIPYDPILKY